jgi:hypothetical protein
MNIKNLKDLVWSILKDNPKTRNDDKNLILKVWEKQRLKLTEQQMMMFFKVAFPETITRLRREIQEQGFFKADSLRQAQRKLFEMKNREKYRNN